MNIENEKRFLKPTRQKHQETDLGNDLLLFKEKKKSSSQNKTEDFKKITYSDQGGKSPSRIHYNFQHLHIEYG